MYDFSKPRKIVEHGIRRTVAAKHAALWAEGGNRLLQVTRNEVGFGAEDATNAADLQDNIGALSERDQALAPSLEAIGRQV